MIFVTLFFYAPTKTIFFRILTSAHGNGHCLRELLSKMYRPLINLVAPEPSLRIDLGTIQLCDVPSISITVIGNTYSGKLAGREIKYE